MSTEVIIGRTQLAVSALIDPRERRIYLPSGTDVLGGDTATFDGKPWRITEAPEVWDDAGIVATFDTEPALLPDSGALFRNVTTSPVLNEETGELVFPADVPAWSGPCSAEPSESQGLTPELGGQRVGVVPFLITVPLSLTDVRTGDQFKVTQSRDPRLATRVLTITAVRGSSSSLVRQLVAFDNQGGA